MCLNAHIMFKCTGNANNVPHFISTSFASCVCKSMSLAMKFQNHGHVVIVIGFFFLFIKCGQ